MIPIDKTENDPAMLSFAARQMLRRICTTNGGGVSWRSASKSDRDAIEELETFGLVQGQNGKRYMVIHTRVGWELNKCMR